MGKGSQRMTAVVGAWNNKVVGKNIEKDICDPLEEEAERRGGAQHVVGYRTGHETRELDGKELRKM